VDNNCSAKDWTGGLVVEDFVLKIEETKTFNIEVFKLGDPLNFCLEPLVNLAKFDEGLDFVEIKRDGENY